MSWKNVCAQSRPEQPLRSTLHILASATGTEFDACRWLSRPLTDEPELHLSMDSTRHLRMLLRHSIAKGMSSWKDVQITKSLQSQQVEKKRPQTIRNPDFPEWQRFSYSLSLSLSLTLVTAKHHCRTDRRRVCQFMCGD